MCDTKNFVSVRLYSAPQSHWTIVAIVVICIYRGTDQAEIDRHIQPFHRLHRRMHPISSPPDIAFMPLTISNTLSQNEHTPFMLTSSA